MIEGPVVNAGPQTSVLLCHKKEAGGSRGTRRANVALVEGFQDVWPSARGVRENTLSSSWQNPTRKWRGLVRYLTVFNSKDGLGLIVDRDRDPLDVELAAEGIRDKIPG